MTKSKTTAQLEELIKLVGGEEEMGNVEEAVQVEIFLAEEGPSFLITTWAGEVMAEEMERALELAIELVKDYKAAELKEALEG